MTLTEFLTARLDEDEATARRAAIPAHDRPGAYQPHPELTRWRYEPYGEVEYVSTPEMQAEEYHTPYRVTQDSEGLSAAVDERRGPHIARHDPARVLAEVDAKRQIVVLHTDQDVHECVPTGQVWPTGGWNDADPWMPCPTLRLLAMPYADHPDYQEEWKP